MVDIQLRFVAQVDQLLNDVGKIGQTAQKSLKVAEDSNKKLTKSLANGAKAAAGFAAAFVGFQTVKKVVGDLSNFSAAVTEISTIAGDAVDVNKEFRDSLIDTAARFGTDAQSQAKSFYSIISAGITDASTAQETLVAANQLAIGGLAGVEESIDILTSAINVFGAENLSAGQASDILFSTVRSGKTTVSELASSLGQVLPSAKALGFSFEEASSSVAALTTKGIATAQATTKLNALFTSLVNVQGKLKGSSDEVRKAFDLNTLSSRGLANVITDIQEATGGSQTELLKYLGSTESLTAFNNLAADSANGLKSALDGITAGAAEEAADKIKNTLGFQLEQLQNNFGNLILKFSSEGEGPLIDIIKGINSLLLDLIENFDTKVQPVMDFIGILLETTADIIIGLIAQFENLLDTVETVFVGAGLLAAKFFNFIGTGSDEAVADWEKSFNQALAGAEESARIAEAAFENAFGPPKEQLKKTEKAAIKTGKAVGKAITKGVEEETKKNPPVVTPEIDLAPLQDLKIQLERSQLTGDQLTAFDIGSTLQKQQEQIDKFVKDGLIKTEKEAQELRNQAIQAANLKRLQLADKQQAEFIKREEARLKAAEDNAKKILDEERKLAEERQKLTLGLINQAASLGANVVGGEQGAKDFVATILAEGGAQAANAIVPGLGEALKPLFGDIAKVLVDGPDAVRKQVREFAAALPIVIEAVAEAAPVLVEEIANKSDEIILALARSTPKFTAALITSAPQIAAALALAVRDLVAEVFRDPSVFANLILPPGSAQVIGALIGDAFNSTEFRVGIQTAVTDFAVKIRDAIARFTFNLGNVFSNLFRGFANIIATIPLPPWVEQLGESIASLMETPGWLKPFEDIVNRLTNFSIGDISDVGGGGGGVIEEGVAFVTSGGSEGSLPFQKGGTVPKGFPNDTFPASLTSGELVIPKDDVTRLQNFLDDNESGGMQSAALMRIAALLARPQQVRTQLNVDGQAFADLMLELDRNNARTTA
jgi:TP901 family phage tail tape measure protein